MNNLRRLSLTILAGALTASMAAPGCASDTTSAEAISTGGGSTEQAILGDRSRMLLEKDLENADINETQIVFNTPTTRVLSLKEGDTISALRKESPFIRKITKYETLTHRGRDVILITTQDAKISELVSRLHTKKHLVLPKINISLKDTSVFDNGIVNVGCGNCTIAYEPTLDLALDVENSKVDHFNATFDGKIISTIELSASAKAGLKFNKEITVFKTHIPLVQAIGPVPIWEDIVVSVNIGVAASMGGKASIRGGVQSSKRMFGSVTYDKGEWQTEHEGEVDFKPIEPYVNLDVGANVRLYVKPQIAVKLYSVAGPYLNTEAFVDFGARFCPKPAGYMAQAGLNVNVGASLDFLSLLNLSVNKTLYTKSIPIANGALPELPFECRADLFPEPPSADDTTTPMSPEALPLERWMQFPSADRSL